LKFTSKFLLILFLFFLFFLSPFKVQPAEILQIKSSDSILLGDQNRNLVIRLFCANVNANDEIDAINFLKKEFPRGSKVKIKPMGYKDNVLTAKVFDVNGTKEMSELLISRNFTKKACLS
jgi:hypothetical protein